MFFADLPDRLKKGLSMKSKKVAPKIEMFKLSQLKPSPYNPRSINSQAMAGLTNSIEKFGLVEPIVVNTRGGKKRIIGGHQRYQALKQLYGAEYQCRCVTVNMSNKEQKALNITLNNPACQGEFTDEIESHIEQLRGELADDRVFLELRMDKLQQEIKSQEGECTYREMKLKPYTKTHVLISFEPDKLPEIAEHLEAIIRTEGIEYEQAAN